MAGYMWNCGVTFVFGLSGGLHATSDWSLLRPVQPNIESEFSKHVENTHSDMG